MPILGQLWFKIALAVVAVIAILGMTVWIIRNLEGAGAAKVDAAVERATNKAVEDARKDKEKADEKVRNSPPDAVIDSTR